MKQLSRLLFLQTIKDSLINSGDLVAKQRFHLFKLATLFTLIVYTSFLVQISMVQNVNMVIVNLVSVFFAIIFLNYLLFAVHKNQKIASITLLGLLYTLLHIVAYKSGGLRNSAMLYIPALILLSYMLIGKRGGLVMAGLTFFHLSLFYYLNRNSELISYDLLGNTPGIIDFDFFITAVLGIWMITIQAGYIEKGKNEIIENIKHKNSAFIEVTERLQLATRAAKIGTWDYDFNNNKLVWDEEMYRIFGVSQENFTPSYTALLASIHVEDRSAIDDSIQMALKGEKELDTVFRLIWPDNSIHYVQSNGIIQRDKDGKSMRMIGANLDISNRINNEIKILELNESLEKKIRERTRELVEKKLLLDEAQHMASIGNWNVNLLTSDVTWSDGTRTILGVDQHYPASFESFISFFHPEDRERAIARFNDGSINRDLIEDEFRIITLKGEARIILSKSGCIFDKEGRIIRMYGILQDITERKVAEETLRRSEANLHNIFDNTKTCYILLDPDLKILSFNPMAQEWAIHALQAELKEGNNYLNYYPIEKHIPLMGKAAKVLGANIDQYEMSYVYKDETIHYYDVLLSPVIIKNDVLGICIALSDITQKKKSEKETQEYVEQLQLKNKNLRQFAFMVSHNLRAPIAKIQGLASLFEQEDVENNAQLIEYISHEVNNLDHVINDMNAIITTGDAENVIRETVHFDTEFKLMIKVLETQIQESGAVISSYFDETPEIISVKSYIYSIMYNLLSNAIKYRRSDITLQIEIKTSTEGDFVCLSVKDNGIGINLDKHKEKIFDLYSRINHTSVPGRGMGLSMVKVQTESLGGRVELESELNQGSLFRIFLPSK